MKLVESILTKNTCCKVGKKITVKGLMLHSVGCPQPRASVFINSWNSESHTNSCVHGFIDANDGTVYQTLPWNYRGWHAGGAANNTHIGVEMCEPACIKYTSGSKFSCSDKETARACVKRTYEAAVELFAMLCKQYGLDPTADGVIISHREGHARGVASNHGDPEHLWSGLGTGNTMDGFRKAVKKAMNSVTEAVNSMDTDAADTDEEKIWKFLFGKIGNAYGTAGLMGELFAESGLRANNLQDSYNKKLNIYDEEYTYLVDGDFYPDFIKDGAGYGLAQWTYWSRKKALLEYAKEHKKSIGDLDMQLDFLWEELQGYKVVLNTLKAAKSVREASDAVLLQYERPADQSEKVQKKRAEYGQAFYDKYAGKTPAPSSDVPFMVRVTATDLRIRTGPGTDYKWTGKYTGRGSFTIVEVKDGKGSSKGWGRLKSGAGWIALDFTQRI